MNVVGAVRFRPVGLLGGPVTSGSRYEEGRVLLVGAIHNENQLFTHEIETLEAEVKTWLSSVRSDASDARYLRAQREAYEQSFGQWTGQVWNNFRKLIRRLPQT